MSRFVKGLLCLVMTLALAAAPTVASAAPARDAEADLVAALEAAWARVVEVWVGVVGVEKARGMIVPDSNGVVVCSESSCSPPDGTDVGVIPDPHG